MSDYFADDSIENKLGLPDPALFHEVEQRIISEKMAVLIEQDFVEGNPDEEALKSIHRVLFEDLYDFAGTFREVDIAKPDSNVPFCYAQFLGGESLRIFKDLKANNYLQGYERSEFTVALTKLAVELNALHPFRDGNGRTIRAYLTMVADRAGYVIDYSAVEASEIIDADKRAFEGNDSLLLALYEHVVLGGV